MANPLNQLIDALRGALEKSGGLPASKKKSDKKKKRKKKTKP